jgi:hypothetical protein
VWAYELRGRLVFELGGLADGADRSGEEYGAAPYQRQLLAERRADNGGTLKAPC